MRFEPGGKRTTQNFVCGRGEGEVMHGMLMTYDVRTGCLLVREGFRTGLKTAVPATTTLMEILYSV